MTLEMTTPKELPLSIVIPLYNESGNIEKLYALITSTLKILDVSYEILFTDDGSTDDSFDKIKMLAQVDPCVCGISLSRNFGHQVALTAGLRHAAGQAVISMDADLQHPPEVIPELYRQYQLGYDIVNTIRSETKGTGLFKNLTSRLFYKLINYLSDTPIVEGAADFRLMSRKALNAYLQLTERSRFARGLVSWLGFKQTYVKFQAPPRFSGKSKYTFRKMLHFATDGITAFSSKPLRLSFYWGLFVAAIGMLYSAYAIYQYTLGRTVPGWASILISVLLLGGIQLISIGILGEYMSRIFGEVKARPLYFIKDATDHP